MAEALSVDFTTNTFTLGGIAKGQITDIDADIKLSSQEYNMPYSGHVKANFIGEIKAQNVLPEFHPHKPYPEECRGGFNIIIVGAGGTGGYLVRDLARYVYSLKEKGDTKEYRITIVDGDVVEKKNLLRQNFTARDEGLYKADVLAKRHAQAFGIEINSIPEMLTSDLLGSLLSNSYSSNTSLRNIVIGCVDNNEARRIIHSQLSRYEFYWIDSGNESKSGQVVVGYKRKPWGTSIPSKKTNFYIPSIADMYPEILDPSKDPVEDEKISCAERAVADSQNIFINMAAAGHALNFTRQILNGDDLTLHGIEFSIKGITTPIYLTSDYIRTVYSSKR